MSMLTPPGMGGKYRIRGNRFPHMRRPRNRRRIVLAVVSASAALALAGWGTIQLVDVFSGGSAEETMQAAHGKGAKGTKSGQGDCKAVPAALPRPDEITVNIYNATPRGGLAKTTADELTKRGFKIGKVGNAPALYDKKVEGTALLLGAPEATEGALRVLGTQVAGTELKNDQRTGKDIDLILGTEFKELSPRPDADRALTEAGGQPAPEKREEKPSQTPSPSPEEKQQEKKPEPPPAKC
ncbi:LytR C-terminal domain-containing protein [Streptomyces sp. ISL-11]|uniref:LytR C-terminal domain-containing protein n=1 Tax=Streptomyces sp. ISL-11 TaxID=2819174 RepID=UPI001BE81AE2|nr:LytR C-terminal domain-containing protein [Streptomyces sp. ISL-11]MBT2383340.1 LytR C-terminal domain-containing protein [Streptomyces sp. ISL-11]